MDRAIEGASRSTLEADLAAIRDSAGVLAGEVMQVERTESARETYLAGIWKA